MMCRIFILTLAVTLQSLSAFAGDWLDVGEWGQAVAMVVLSHEAGHYRVGQGEDPYDPRSGSAAVGYNLSGAYGLSYKLTRRTPAPTLPDATKYSGYFVQNGTSYLPPASYAKWQSDTQTAKQEFNLWLRKEVYPAEGAVAGAGFVGGQAAANSSELLPSLRRKALVFNGAMQLGYIGYHYLHRGNTGDIERMTMAVPTELILGALAASGISDLWRGMQDTPPAYRLDFFSSPRTGAVGLLFSGTF